jgi:hypothetical protein
MPVEHLGPFELVVKGDKAGLSVTTQQCTIRATGEEYTRILAGTEVVIPWYLSGSPHGTNISVSGLYRFKVIDGNLIQFIRDGDQSVPVFTINANGELVAEFPEE